MASAALQREAFMPRAPRGMGSGLALALGVHVLLVVALAFSVNWHTSSPAVAEAELWGAVPQVAAPRAVDPEPPPPPKPVPVPVKPPPPPVARAEPEPAKVPDAQIAIEKAKKEEAKRQKIAEEQERELKEKQELAKKTKEAEQERKAAEALAKVREENIKKILGDANATGAAEAKGAALESKSLSPSYAGRLKARVKPNIVFPDAIDGNPVAEVEVRCAPDGRIISRRLSKPSGVKSWDEAVLRAIDKTEVFPLDEGRMPSPLTLVFSPRD